MQVTKEHSFSLKMHQSFADRGPPGPAGGAYGAPYYHNSTITYAHGNGSFEDISLKQ